MADTFTFKLVTPTGIVFDGAVEQATAVNPLGEFGVLATHTNYVTALVPGMLTLKLAEGNFNEFLLVGGLAEVKDGAMTVLALEAFAPGAVDSGAAAHEVRDAEEKVSQMSFYEPGYFEAENALKLARARAQIDQLRRAPH
ncbi:MAG: ATP synthase F1 subunit epsilon [Candidatus Binataceae bacterium]